MEAVALTGLELAERKIEVERHWFILDASKVEEDVFTCAFVAEVGILAPQAARCTRSALRRVGANA